MQDENFEALRTILGDFGISVSPLDHLDPAGPGLRHDMRLRRGDSSQVYAIHSSLDDGQGLSTARVDQIIAASRESEDRRLLLVTDRLNARTKTAYRNRNVDYVDLAGNALIRFGEVYIDIQGRPAKTARIHNGMRHAPVNLFSARRAQVIFALIVWPELFTLPIRYTSEAAGVSIGIAFQTTQLLKDSGYLIGGANPYLIRKSELIDRWTDSYSTGLKNKLAIANFRGEHLDILGRDAKEPWLVSGEYAVRSMLRPTTLTIYVEKLEPELILANRWRRDNQPNIEVRKKFWKDPRQILDKERAIESHDFDAEAPTLLIYADLMTSGDGRQREIAKSFRDTHRELLDD